MYDFSQVDLTPNYALTDAARYLRLPASKARRWADALNAHDTDFVGDRAIRFLSYVNLLEMHVLKALRIKHSVPMQRIRRALSYVHDHMPSPHPLLDQKFATDGLDLFLDRGGDLVNASREGQLAMREVLSIYLSRIEWKHGEGFSFFPFVIDDRADEPKIITMRPTIAFGRPVIAGTGISTEVIAGRFFGREDITDLANEYQLPVATIAEAIRWESVHAHAA